MVMTLAKEDELVFKRDSFSSIFGWVKYTRNEKLNPSDFRSEDDYIKWLLIDLELWDYAVIIVDGLKGAGKSLFDAWLAKQNNRHFSKGVTTNTKLKNTFGLYNYIDEQLFINEWVKLTELADRDDADVLKNDIIAMTKYSMFYNRTIIIDEARKWVWKRRPNARILQYIGELLDVVRHNHDVVLFSCANAERIVDYLTVWESRTHEVNCSFNTTYRGYATYSIKHRNTGKVRWLHLSAKNNADLWESENLVGMSKPITKKQLQQAYDVIRIREQEKYKK